MLARLGDVVGGSVRGVYADQLPFRPRSWLAERSSTSRGVVKRVARGPMAGRGRREIVHDDTDSTFEFR